MPYLNIFFLNIPIKWVRKSLVAALFSIPQSPILMDHRDIHKTATFIAL